MCDVSGNIDRLHLDPLNVLAVHGYFEVFSACTGQEMSRLAPAKKDGKSPTVVAVNVFGHTE